MSPSSRFSTLLLLLALGVPAAGQERARLTFEDALGRAQAAFAPAMPRPWRFASDGATLLDPDGRPFDPRTMEPAEAPAEEESPAPVASAFGEALREAGRPASRQELTGRPSRSTLPRTPEPVPGLRATPDGQTAAAFLGDDLWAFARGSPARRVLAGAGPVRRFEIAPDGKTVSFIRDDNLHLVHLADGASFQLTDDGSEDLFYGELDWVYQEEVYGRFNFKATWWAPGGDHLAFLRIDQSGVDTFTVVDHIPNQLKREELKYPKAGTVNPRASLHLADARTGRRVAVDLSKYPEEDEILIVQVDWAPDGNAVVFYVQNREQTWLDLNAADPSTGSMKTLLRETSDSWVNIPSPLRWLRDGTFIWESERTGFKHLYRYGSDGALAGAITEGPWQVNDVLRVDEESGTVFFMGTKDGHLGPNAYRVDLDGSNLVRLTAGRGTHRVTLDESGEFLLDSVSSMVDLPEQRLCCARTGEVLRVLAKAGPPPAEKTYGVILPELVRIPCRDGFEIDATLIKPSPFQETKAHPVWIETYSGPAAPSIRDAYRINLWHQFLAHQGVLVFQVNVRSAAGSGHVHTSTCYRQFGVQELRDMDDAVDWLTAHPWADGDRVGITGWSYGGTMAAFALTNSTKYRLGIAGAGVYDWRLYDTIYTERYMGIPRNNPDGYKASSVVESAKNLHGHLLIIHGTMDDNVHLQNAIQLVYALQKAGKRFEMMLYPRNRHGIADQAQSVHHRRLVWDTIQAHLLN